MYFLRKNTWNTLSGNKIIFCIGKIPGAHYVKNFIILLNLGKLMLILLNGIIMMWMANIFVPMVLKENILQIIIIVLWSILGQKFEKKLQILFFFAFDTCDLALLHQWSLIFTIKHDFFKFFISEFFQASCFKLKNNLIKIRQKKLAYPTINK